MSNWQIKMVTHPCIWPVGRGRVHVRVDETLVLPGNAKVNAQDRNGHLPLHFAIAEGRTDVVTFLISHGADVDMRN
jgi:ankyrin repeat protein